MYEEKRIEIEFYFIDQYQTMKDFHGEVENQAIAALPGAERGA